MEEQLEQTAEVRQHYVRRSRRPKRSLGERVRGSSSRALTAGYVVAGVLVLCLLAVGVDAAASAGRVHPGVRLSGISVGGKKPDEAKAVLQRELTKRAAAAVVVEAEDQQWKVMPAELEASFDYDALVEDAMDVGRTESPVAERFRAWFGGVDVTAAAEVDDKAFASFLKDVKKPLNVAPKNAKVVVDGTEVDVVASEKGIKVVEPKLRSGIQAAIASENRSVRVPLAVDPPSVTEAGAAEAAEAAQRMVSAPVTVTYKDEFWEYEPDEIGGWLKFRRVPAAAGEATGSPEVLQCSVDAKSMSKSMSPHLEDVGRQAKDAEFHTSGGEVTITPSQDGQAPDYKALSRSLASALNRSGEARTAEMRLKISKPKLTTQKAKSMGIKERISTYTTEYDSGNAPRTNNIHLLADAIDGTLVEPGGTFSFNGAVGPRTAEKGYQEANAIVQGRLVPQLGGGICQVGTTVFNAVFESGFPVVERHNHSFYISHYPKGRDATVSWDGPDFRFRNDSKKWVLVAAGYTADSVTISIYGTDPGYEVTAETGEFYDRKPYPVEQVKDAKLEKGAKLVEDGGVDGRSVKVKRIVKKNGKVVREETFTSVYKPKIEIVKVGTKKPAPKKDAKPKEAKKP
ncbi:MAG: VanW family protein [Coriobacteriales bacterium]|nr:VanW family protein [Coriobacteriales bacterium]